MGSNTKTPKQFFRAGVGAVIQRGDGMVLAFRRVDDPDAWQLPQGGLEAGEEPLDALFREIAEETGIERSHIELLSHTPKLLAYELPGEYRSRKTGRGQVLYWFNLSFMGADEHITLGDGKEFSAWRWMPLDELVSIVAPFRRETYTQLQWPR
jgi:putative (di)nucleoside polyphosphate hydrolase